VLVYRLARRATTTAVALLATIFFLGFVTYFQDMPMLNRQEVAFLFLVSALLVLLTPDLTRSSRRRWFLAFAAGMVVSHYSTTYFAVGVLAGAWGLRVAAGPLRRALRHLAPKTAARATDLTAVPRGGYALGIGIVAALAAMSYLWAGPVTHTESALSSTLSSTIRSLESLRWVRSGDTNYSLFGGAPSDPSVLLAAQQAALEKKTATAREQGVYYPLASVEQYPTPVMPGDTLALTWLGRGLERLGANPASFNYDVRQGSAKLLQILIFVGLLVAVLARRRPVRAPPPEFMYLGGGSLAMLVFGVVLPTISVDYGVLRAFQQALMVLGVFVVIGILGLVSWASRGRAIAVATAVTLAFFASSTGVITQALGGYGPQLHLNNSGEYYDLYLTRTTEIAAVEWLNADTAGPHTQATLPVVQMSDYTFQEVQTYAGDSVINTINPLVIRPYTYVLLGPSDLTAGTSEFLQGDVISYRYPVAFLDANKDLLYNNGSARVYR
jgi:hypothetical protein